MVMDVKIDDPKGYITVKRGVLPVFPFGEKVLITKFEAKSVSVVVKETSSTTWQLGIALLALMALLPISPSKKLHYEVKIRSSSGENITLFKHHNVDIANDIVNQIVDFTQKG